MKKHIFGRKLSRTTNERNALFRGLMRAVVLEERIQTTEAKAKSIKGELEKLVTKAIKKGDAAKKDLQKHFPPEVVNKIIKDIAPRFANRPGGYTRLTHLGSRMKDNAPMVMLEWVVLGTKGPLVKEEKKEKKVTKTEKVEAKVAVKEEKKKVVKKATKEKKDDNKANKK